MVELGLEPAVLPTSHLTAGERPRLGCPEKWGRLVNDFTEAGAGQRSPWNGTRLQGLTPHEAEPRACLLVQSPQPFRTGLQRTPRKRPQLRNSHCSATVRGAQEVTGELVQLRPSGLATFSFAKPREAPAGSLEGASESSLCSVPPAIFHSEPLLPAPGSLPHCWSA